MHLRTSLLSWSPGARRGFVATAIWAALLVLGAVFPPQPSLGQEGAQPAANARRSGHWIRISQPISDRTLSQAQRQVDSTIKLARQQGEWPVFIFEIQPGRSEFAPTLGLAQFLSGPSLNGSTSVAYIPQSIDGHAVLAAIACDQIVMDESATIGDAGKYETVIGPAIRAAYAETADRRKTVPRDLALGMLDPALEVHVVETDVSREFALSERLAELRERKAFQNSKILKPAGKPGVFSGLEGRELGFVNYLASEPAEVAKALALPPGAIQQDPAAPGEWVPILVNIEGVVSARHVDEVQSLVNAQTSDHGANFICVSIDSAGGSMKDSVELSIFLAAFDPAEVRTVAYIDRDARGDAALIALACDHIIMREGAHLGGPGEQNIEKQEAAAVAASLEELAAKKLRSPSVARAFVDPETVVFQYTRDDGLVDYLTEEKAAALEDAKRWTKGKQVTSEGQTLRLTAERAVELGVAREMVQDFSELKAVYGLTDDPRLTEPGWAHYLVTALNKMRWFLLVIAIVAMYVELHTPGIGLGALLACISMMLFFWSTFLGGTAGWLEALLFVAGLVCLSLEIFVIPGFGVFGLFGGMMILASIVLASQTFIFPRNSYQIAQFRNSLLALSGVSFAAIVAASFARSYLPRAPVLNHMVLSPPSEEERRILSQREAVADFSALIGAVGETATPLMPGGKAQFGEMLVDVVANGQFIDRGAQIRVVEVHGNRIVVEQNA